MAAFDLKVWLDSVVVPLTRRSIPLSIYSFIWNGEARGAPKEVLVWLHTGPTPHGPEESNEGSAQGPPSPPGNDASPPEATVDKASFLGSDVDEEGSPKVAFDPDAWPRALRMLLEEDGFRFDFLREQTMVSLPGGHITIFGGDGAPLYNNQGMASARLFRKEEDGVALILQVGCQYPSGLDAAAATKSFYQSFDESPLEVCQKFGTAFGQA